MAKEEAADKTAAGVLTAAPFASPLQDDEDEDALAVTSKELVPKYSTGQDASAGENAAGDAGALEASSKRKGLLAAVNEGNEAEVGKMLGERRAEVDMIDSGGATPLMLACHQGNPQLVQLLLDYNASVTTRTTVARNSVMHFAAKNGSEAVIKLLMERDATLLDSPNKNLDTPLMMAVLARNHMAASCILKYSTKSLDFQNKSLNTALHLAGKIGDMKLVRLLLDYGANLTLRNDAGQTALDMAKVSGNRECIEYLTTIWKDIEERSLKAQELLFGESDESCSGGGGKGGKGGKAKKKKTKDKKKPSATTPKLHAVTEGADGGGHAGPDGDAAGADVSPASGPLDGAAESLPPLELVDDVSSRLQKHHEKERDSNDSASKQRAASEVVEDEARGRLTVRTQGVVPDEDPGPDGDPSWNVVQRKAKEKAPAATGGIGGMPVQQPQYAMYGRDRDRHRQMMRARAQQQLQQHQQQQQQQQQHGGKVVQAGGKGQSGGQHAGRQQAHQQAQSPAAKAGVPYASVVSGQGESRWAVDGRSVKQEHHHTHHQHQAQSADARLRRDGAGATMAPPSDGASGGGLGTTGARVQGGSSQRPWSSQQSQSTDPAVPSLTSALAQTSNGLMGSGVTSGASRTTTMLPDFTSVGKGFYQQNGHGLSIDNDPDLAAAIASANGDPSFLSLDVDIEELLTQGRFSPPTQTQTENSFLSIGDYLNLHHRQGPRPGSPPVRQLPQSIGLGSKLSYAEAMRSGASLLDVDSSLSVDDLLDEGGEVAAGGPGPAWGKGEHVVTQKHFEERFPHAQSVALMVESLCSTSDTLAHLSMSQLEALRDVFQMQMREVEAAMIEQARRQERWRSEEQLRVATLNFHPSPGNGVRDGGGYSLMGGSFR